GGTSGASPVVAGVAALILDANEDLGWRDVQTIFAYSAHEVGSGVGGTRTRDEDHDWFVNGADNWNGGGLHFSEDYGFGSVNAYNAVRFAEVWSLFNSAQTSSNEDSFSVSRGSINLPDNRATDVTFTVTEDSFEVEYVEIALDITHSHLADLAIELISPDGTVTQLFTNDGNGSLGDRGWVWTLGANAFRGEDAAGTWTLRIDDTDARDSGRLNSASLTFFGRDGDNANLNNDVYHFTDEFSDFVGDDASRKTISDRSGVDWLNAAAVATASTIDFNAGTARIDGVNLSVSGIENAVTGDGNDTLKGDGDTNSLHGMRGNDRIDGEGGGDDLAGGQGNDTIGGGEGDDTINGNQGRDRIEAGSGRDVARGGDQRDVILGQNGNDNLSGGRGNDRVSGGSGDDTLTGNSGNDKISGGRNSDVLSGGHGDDTLLGRSGNDLLNGNTGHDSLIGGNGSDTLNGGTGNDALNGGAQADIFRFNNNWDVDTIEDFKDGTDLIDFSSNSDVNSLADLSIAANGGNAIITEVGSPGNVIIVAGAASLIDGADFIF
ncbi:MAG: proprotein convertase P-domain-containing protein, partial [Pseudomonadota bacterium]